LRAGDLEIDLDSHLVSNLGAVIDLTPTEFNLLATLAAQPGRAFSRLQLLEATQGAAYEGYERTIDAHIKNLRAKIEKDAKSPTTSKLFLVLAIALPVGNDINALAFNPIFCFYWVRFHCKCRPAGAPGRCK
jgi:hypothetical protein